MSKSLPTRLKHPCLRRKPMWVPFFVSSKPGWFKIILWYEKNLFTQVYLNTFLALRTSLNYFLHWCPFQNNAGRLVINISYYTCQTLHPSYKPWIGFLKQSHELRQHYFLAINISEIDRYETEHCHLMVKALQDWYQSCITIFINIITLPPVDF